MRFDESKNRFKDKDYKYSRSNIKPKKQSKKSIFIILFLLILSIGAGVYTGVKYTNTKKMANKLYQPAESTRNVSKVEKLGKPISILLLGTDTGALGRTYQGRTDTIIIATLNPEKETMRLTSLPRDLAVKVKGYENNGVQKLNSAYAFGGIQTAQDTISKALNIPIDYYALLNMGGLEKVVNAVGGVTVKPPLTFHYQQANVQKGKEIHLNGAQALAYSRMRHEDPQGDYGRQTRQRQVIMAIIKNAQSFKTLFNAELFNSLQGQLQTNVKFDNGLSLYQQYHLATHHLVSTHMQGVSQTLEGQDFEVAKSQVWQNETKAIRSYLQLPLQGYQPNEYAVGSGTVKNSKTEEPKNSKDTSRNVTSTDNSSSNFSSSSSSSSSSSKDNDSTDTNYNGVDNIKKLYESRYGNN